MLWCFSDNWPLINSSPTTPKHSALQLQFNHFLGIKPRKSQLNRNQWYTVVVYKWLYSLVCHYITLHHTFVAPCVGTNLIYGQKTFHVGFWNYAQISPALFQCFYERISLVPNHVSSGSCGLCSNRPDTLHVHMSWEAVKPELVWFC